MINASHELAEMQNYLIALILRRMTKPAKQHVLSDIITARTPEEEPLSFEELVATARALLIDAHDSMSTAFTNILFQVATDPAIATQFFKAAEVVRRWDVSSRNSCISSRRWVLSRVTTAPVTLGGSALPEGAHLLILFASANDGESVFECPRKFDAGRINIRKSMTFGAGVHLCLGIALARMQLLVAARQTAKRLKGLDLGIPIEDVRYIPNAALLAMERLPLTFAPRPKEGLRR